MTQSQINPIRFNWPSYEVILIKIHLNWFNWFNWNYVPVADPLWSIFDDSFVDVLSTIATAAAVVDIIAAADSAACGNNCFRIWNGVGDGDLRKKPFFEDAPDADKDDDDCIVIICGGDESARSTVSSIFPPSLGPFWQK